MQDPLPDSNEKELAIDGKIYKDWTVSGRYSVIYAGATATRFPAVVFQITASKVMDSLLNV